jgi:Putative MetA-pathway of phenol degradation
MWRNGLAILGGVLLTAASIRAQTSATAEVTIATDRPAVSSSSVAVPLGGFQVENGMLGTNQQGNWALDLPESLIRYGLLGKTELRLYVPDYYQNFASGSSSGFGDIAFGVKQQLGPVAGFDVSAIFYVSVPSGASNISSHGYDPAVQVPWTRKLSENWTAGGQVAFYWPTQGGSHNFTGETAFFLDRQLTKPCDAFVEYAGDFPQRGGSRQQIHIGTAYKITPRQQIDFHFAFGLTSAAPKGYVGVGYSILFLTRGEK